MAQTKVGSGFVATGAVGPTSLSTGAPYWDTSGNVGIGTTSPSAKLNVYDATSSTFSVQGDSAASAIIQRSISANTAPQFGLRKSRGTIASPTAVASGDGLGQILFQAYGGSNYRNLAVISGYVDTYTSDTDISGFLSFATSPSGSAAQVERMRIDSSGNVGIGTSSPQCRGDFRASSGLGIRFLETSSGNTNRIELGTGSGIGYVNADAGAGSIVLGFNVAGTERARIDSSGNLIVGATSFSSGTNSLRLAPGNLSIRCNVSTTYEVCNWLNSNGQVGTISLNGTSTSYNTSSDYRLKENVQPMTTGLTTVSALKPVTYDWVSDKSAGEGFIAHELQSVIPLAVTGEKDAVDEEGNIKPQGVDYSKIVVHLVAGMQEQQAQITSLKEELDALKAKVGP